MTSRSTRPALLRLALAAAAGVVAVLPALLTPGPAVAGGAPVTATTAARVPADAALAAGWLAGERDAVGGVPGPFAGTDWGLTVDTLWAMKAGGASTVDLQRTWGAIAANVKELAGPPSWSTDTTLRFGGGTAKVLVAAQSVGADPRAVRAGGTTYDLVAATLDRVATTGPQVGRVEDSASAGVDSTNVLGQALAVIGLGDAGVATGADAPTLRSALGFLASQQCAPGWFRVFYDDDLTCDAALAKGDATGDVDGTAMAVQALVAARDAGLAVEPGTLDSAVAWLVSAQHGDGSFGGGTSTSGANANSTGLAAAALQLSGRTAQAAKARTWVAGLQLTGTTGPLAGDRGAIAYDASTLADARAHGIADTSRDQWRRATAQAVFALNPVGLSQLADLPAGGGLPTPPPTPPAPPTPRPTTPAATTPSGHSSAAAVPSSPRPSGSSARSTPSTRETSGLGPVSGSGSGAPGRDERPRGPVGSGSTSDATSTPPAGSTTPTTTTTNRPEVEALTPRPSSTQGVAVASAATAAQTGAGSPWRSPLVLAVVIGVLLGLVVVLRPWRLLGGRAR